jgi:hypothetical protein
MFMYGKHDMSAVGTMDFFFQILLAFSMLDFPQGLNWSGLFVHRMCVYIPSWIFVDTSGFASAGTTVCTVS